MNTANTVIMVKPRHFSYNEQTAVDNAFQNKIWLNSSDIRILAMKEFRCMKALLEEYNICVIEIDSPMKYTPDAVFPNNWFSTHYINGKRTLFIYPMLSKNRQEEVQLVNLISSLPCEKNYKVIDLRTMLKGENRVLEGTGAMVFDHYNRYIFMSRSNRTDDLLANYVASRLNYSLINFSSNDKKQKSIYHTNVMMSIGEHIAFICLDVIGIDKEKNMVYETLLKCKKIVIVISYNQMMNMLGNVIELKNIYDESFLILSSSANNSLNQYQKNIIDKYCKRLVISIPTIEKVGGGSVRCMLAEVF